MRDWIGGRRRRAVLLSVAAVAALVLIAVSYGSDGDGDGDREPVKWSPAEEPAGRFIDRFAKLIETTKKRADCGQLDEITARSYFRPDCPAEGALRRSMGDFERVGVAEYGTGAVVDYRSGKLPDGATIVLFVAPDRNWGISRFGVLTRPSTDTDDGESRASYDRAVERYLAAVEDRDCAAYLEVAMVSDVPRRGVCKTKFAGTALLARRLKRSPAAKPRYLGGNGTYGFYGLETQRPEPENSTISVVREIGGRAVVLDVAPSPTAAEQRDVLRQYREQQRNPPSSDGMGPGSKPTEPAIK